MSTGLLHRLALGVWAIDATRAQAYYGVVGNLLSGKPVQLGTKRELLATVVKADMMPCEGDDGEVEVEASASDVLVISINDVILKRGDECSYGMEDVADVLEGANKDPNVAGVVLCLDTPGGEGSGMMLLADQLGRMQKPVLAHLNHGMAASAGYGIAAACREIYCASEQDMLGSTGTYVTLMDMAAYMRKEGLPIHEIYATLSTDKNGPAREAMKAPGDGTDSEHYQRMRAEFIDPFNEAFLSMIVAKRPQMKDSQGSWNTGSLFFAKDALPLGMFDGYKTLNETVARVRELAAAKPSGTTTQLQTPASKATNPAMSKFTTLFNTALAALGLTEQKPEPTAEDITNANTTLAEAGLQLVTADQATLLGSIADLQAKAAQVEELHTKLVGETAKLSAVNDTLKAALEANNVNVEKDADMVTAAVEALNAFGSRTTAKHTGSTKEGDDKPKPSDDPTFAAARQANITIGE